MYRVTTNAVIGGVCSGVAYSTGINLSLVRLITFISLFLDLGLSIIIYLAAWFFIPKL
jgi:phage shock protein PspC (stress-responsive transcriptional regulator)